MDLADGRGASTLRSHSPVGSPTSSSLATTVIGYAFSETTAGRTCASVRTSTRRRGPALAPVSAPYSAASADHRQFTSKASRWSDAIHR